MDKGIVDVVAVMVETVYPYPTWRKLLVRVGHLGKSSWRLEVTAETATPRGNPRSVYEKRMTNAAISKKLQEHGRRTKVAIEESAVKGLQNLAEYVPDLSDTCIWLMGRCLMTL